MFLQPAKSFSSKLVILKANASFQSIQQCYQFHKVSLSKNIDFISEEKIHKEKGNLEVNTSNTEKPLVLLYPWMLAKEKHVSKFSKLYTNMGAEVLKVKLTPWDLLRPTKGSQVVAQDVLNFLETNQKFQTIMIHGFSVGAYAFCEAVVKMEADKARYDDVKNRFIGQIWDSPVDIYGIPSGLSKAVTKNKVLQKSLEQYLRWYLKARQNSATKHYMKSSQMMHNNAINVPGLWLYSKADPVSPPEMNERTFANWKQADNVCFEDSGHVSHYHKHKNTYETEIFMFMEKIGFRSITQRQALQI